MRVWGETLEARTDPRNLLNPWKIRNKNPWDALGKGEIRLEVHRGKRHGRGNVDRGGKTKKNRTTISQKRTQSDKINRKHE
ncbi:hypothetical protein NPIL_183451, partial [Nephila pilipes]